MLKITPQQMTGFSHATTRGFAERMVRHLSERFPLHCAGAPDLLGKVQQAIGRAALYHLTSEKDVCRFIEVATALGEKFDLDRKFPWAPAILGDTITGAPAGAMDRLHAEASAYLAEAGDSAADAEASAALARGPFDEEPFSDRAAVGGPVMPCPKVALRRLYSFSS